MNKVIIRLEALKEYYIKNKNEKTFNGYYINTLNKYLIEYIVLSLQNKIRIDETKIGGTIKIQPYIDKILPDFKKIQILDNKLESVNKDINKINLQINKNQNIFPDGSTIVKDTNKDEIYNKTKHDLLNIQKRLYEEKIKALEIIIESILLLNNMLKNKLAEKRTLIEDYDIIYYRDLETLKDLCKNNLTDQEKNLIYNDFGYRYLEGAEKLLSMPPPPLVFPSVPKGTPKIVSKKGGNKIKI